VGDYAAGVFFLSVKMDRAKFIFAKGNKMPFSVSTRSVRSLLADETLDIPEHQRPYVWDGKKASAFIASILDDLPTHALFLYQAVEGGMLKKWLEDGQQRWLTVKGYIRDTDVITMSWKRWNESGTNVPDKYSNLSEENKQKILNYSFTIYTIENMSYDARMCLFQRLQDGKALTNGQRFNACVNMPLVRLAKRIMDDPRCHAVWGKRVESKGFTALTNAVAIAAGLALKNDDHIVTSYNILGPDLNKPYNDVDVNQRLDKLLDVYNRAQEVCRVGITELKKQWAVGYFTGYILYNLNQPDIDWDSDSQMWVDYIVRCRKDKAAYYILKSSQPASRAWNSVRWGKGLQHVRNPELVEIVNSNSDDGDESDE